MAYPTLPTLDSSEPDQDDGIETSRATNGRLRKRRLFPAAKMSFTLKHWLTAAELATLMAHWEANQDLAFAYTWPEDGIERSCTYAKKPSPPRTADEPGCFTVTVMLEEV